MSDALLDALRRSVEARNQDPERMRRWLDDYAERTEGEYHGSAEDSVQG